MATSYLRHFPRAKRLTLEHTPRPSTWTLWQGPAALVCGLDHAGARELLTQLRQEFPHAALRLTRQAA